MGFFSEAIKCQNDAYKQTLVLNPNAQSFLTILAQHEEPYELTFITNNCNLDAIEHLLLVKSPIKERLTLSEAAANSNVDDTLAHDGRDRRVLATKDEKEVVLSGTIKSQYGAKCQKYTELSKINRSTSESTKPKMVIFVDDKLSNRKEMCEGFKTANTDNIVLSFDLRKAEPDDGLSLSEEYISTLIDEGSVHGLDHGKVSIKELLSKYAKTHDISIVSDVDDTLCGHVKGIGSSLENGRLFNQTLQAVTPPSARPSVLRIKP